MVSNAYLFEPVLAQILGYYAGIDEAPGIMTIIGLIIALIGIVLIDYTFRLKQCLELKDNHGWDDLKEPGVVADNKVGYSIIDIKDTYVK